MQQTDKTTTRHRCLDTCTGEDDVRSAAWERSSEGNSEARGLETPQEAATKRNSHIPHFSWWCRSDSTTRENSSFSLLLFFADKKKQLRDHILPIFKTWSLQMQDWPPGTQSPFCWIYKIKLWCLLIYMHIRRCRQTAPTERNLT